MVSSIDNGKSQKWRNYGTDDIYEETDIEQLNAGVIESHNYKFECTPYQQFYVLLKRMILQTVRNRVSIS